MLDISGAVFAGIWFIRVFPTYPLLPRCPVGIIILCKMTFLAMEMLNLEFYEGTVLPSGSLGVEEVECDFDGDSQGLISY